MRKVIVSEYVTLVGLIGEPGLWSSPFWSEDTSNFKHDELFACGVLLLGRVTYEGFAKAWPTMEGTGDYGERMNSLPKYVASTTLNTAEWNASVMKGSVPETVAELKQQSGQAVLVFGSGQLVHTLMQSHLFDEYRLIAHPIIVGSGKRPFPEGSEQQTLQAGGDQAVQVRRRSTHSSTS